MPDFSKYPIPDKVFLSGQDCFHLMLDLHAKKHETGGNVMRQVFYFRHRVNEKKIRTALLQSPAIHWLCNITLNRGSLFSLPFWKYTNAGREIRIQTHEVELPRTIPDEILQREMPVGAPAYIEADFLYYSSGESAFVLSWNHILLDAKGSALLFAHLGRVGEGIIDDAEVLFPKTEQEPGLLSNIRNMYGVKAFIQQSSKKPVSSVFIKKSASGKNKCLQLVVPFTAGETQRIQEAGITAGSKFGLTHYYLACCAHIIHRLNVQRGNPGPLWIPVPYDGRLKGSNGPLFSNNVSFIFYRIEPEHLKEIPLTVSSLVKQMTDQIRTGMPKKYNLLLSMMRHFPLWLYYFLISRTGEGTFASFLYTGTGENFSQTAHFTGEKLSGMGMVTALTFPPGLTFVFMKHGDELSLNINYSPGVISDTELNFVVAGIKKLLLNS